MFKKKSSNNNNQEINANDFLLNNKQNQFFFSYAYWEESKLNNNFFQFAEYCPVENEKKELSNRNEERNIDNDIHFTQNLTTIVKEHLHIDELIVKQELIDSKNLSNNELNKKAIDSITILALDQIQHANSGHPGIALGAASILYTIFAYHLHFNVSDPSWKNRDRFVLSAGHGSSLLYSTMFHFGYFVTIDDLKAFRKFNSCTAGHPKYWDIPGIETTTGPLGSGLATAIGMAFTSKWLKDNVCLQLKKQRTVKLFDNYTYVLISDGDLQEGISYESMSLAGLWKLKSLIVIYDSNNVQLDTNCEFAINENIKQRVESQNWEYFYVEDGTSVHSINKAIWDAKNSNSDKPKFIEIKTIIGNHSKNANNIKAHGSPLDEDDFANIKNELNWNHPPFHVNYEVLHELKTLLFKRSVNKYKVFNKQLDLLKKYNSALHDCFFLKYINFDFTKILSHLPTSNNNNKSFSSREILGKIFKYLYSQNLNILGGSADLGSSTRITYNDKYFHNNLSGRILQFGVRESAMTAIINGIALFGLHYSFGSSFLAFSDNSKLQLRLSAMMNVNAVHFYSHDSIFAGEDGETHQPVEQIGALQSIPNLNVWRPYNAEECLAAIKFCFSQEQDNASVIISSRHKYLQFSSMGIYDNIAKGAHIIKYEQKNKFPDIILLSSGSEVAIAIQVSYMLEEAKLWTRVISVPSLTEFLKPENISYQKYLLNNFQSDIFVIEASNNSNWTKLIPKFNFNEQFIGIHSFGASAPKEILETKFHLDPLSIFVYIYSKFCNYAPSKKAQQRIYENVQEKIDPNYQKKLKKELLAPALFSDSKISLQKVKVQAKKIANKIHDVINAENIKNKMNNLSGLSKNIQSKTKIGIQKISKFFSKIFNKQKKKK